MASPNAGAIVIASVYRVVSVCHYSKNTILILVNPLKGRGINWLHFVIQV